MVQWHTFSRCAKAQATGCSRLHHHRQKARRGRSNTGAGTNCNGKQHPSRHGVVRSGSQMMDADASQKESRDRSIKPHNGRQISSCEKACTVRNGEDNAAAGQKKAQSQSVLESSQEESESESESASSSDGTDAEESGSDDGAAGRQAGDNTPASARSL